MWKSRGIISCCDCHRNVSLTYVKFQWSQCNHYYCVKCAASIINRSLNSNKRPRCIIHGCNQILEINNQNKDIQPSLPQYKYIANSQLTAKHYSTTNHLISGYYRSALNSNNIILNDVMLLILDYYVLILTKKSSKNIQCTECLSVGTITKNCWKCENTPGIRTYIATCKICRGKGYIELSKAQDDPQNSMTVVHLTRVNCPHCFGKKHFKKQKLCDLCNGTLYFSDNCSNCGGCRVLDFNKICNKSLKCCQCNLYHSKNNIIYWSNKCCHPFCMKCMLYFIQKEIGLRRIPMCLDSNCKKLLSLDTMNQLINTSITTYRRLSSGRTIGVFLGLLSYKDACNLTIRTINKLFRKYYDKYTLLELYCKFQIDKSTLSSKSINWFVDRLKVPDFNYFTKKELFTIFNAIHNSFFVVSNKRYSGYVKWYNKNYRTGRIEYVDTYGISQHCTFNLSDLKINQKRSYLSRIYIGQVVEFNICENKLTMKKTIINITQVNGEGF